MFNMYLEKIKFRAFVEMGDLNTSLEAGTEL
jgi:hypothetical protein